MIQDYYNLKRHCATTYSIKNKKFNVGDLSATQLEIGIEKLSKKPTPTLAEEIQLKAMEYVLICSLNKPKIDQAEKTADVISNWIQKSYKPHYNDTKEVKKAYEVVS
jgi:hypothetical protein